MTQLNIISNKIKCFCTLFSTFGDGGGKDKKKQEIEMCVRGQEMEMCARGVGERGTDERGRRGRGEGGGGQRERERERE
jgi:hypothetical protein